MKKFISLLTIGIMCSGLTACSMPELPAQEAGNSSYDINIFDANGAELEEGIEAAVQENVSDLEWQVYNAYQEDVQSRCKYKDCTDFSFTIFENEELIGQVADMSFGVDNTMLTLDDKIVDADGEVLGQASEDFENFYMPYQNSDVITQNTDGSYSLYYKGEEYRFQIEEGTLLASYLSQYYAAEDVPPILVTKSFVWVDNQVVVYFHNAETGELLKTVDELEISSEYIKGQPVEIMTREMTTNGVGVFVLDAEGNLFGNYSGCAIALNQFDYEYDLRLGGYKAEVTNVEQLLASSTDGAPVYSKKDDTTHIYTIDMFSKEEIVIDLPEGYTTSDIDKLIIGMDSMIIFKDQSIYTVDIDDNTHEKLEELTKLYQDGHVLAFGVNLMDLLVLMDDNTIYSINN
ncbi:MAG: hypothetical protein II994_04820 [Lachnospiraceae bacterium]|nr:hypothetical protein [Lachnospiraceae bacterium]